MGALYLASKLEECPLRMRDLINVYDLLLQRAAHTVASTSSSHPPPDFKYAPMSYFGNTCYDLKDALVVSEMQILKRLGFNVHVVLPYGTLVNYMRLLGLTGREDAVSKAWGYLNDAYVSPRFRKDDYVDALPLHRLQTPVYALFAVPTIVSAAILLTVRHLGISLPSTPENSWWELFDAEWDDVWNVCGYIMRLYRDRSLEDRVRVIGLIGKKEVRRWLDERVIVTTESM